MRYCLRPVSVVFIAGALTATLFGQQDRITAPISNSRLVTLAGHVSPRIRAAVDEGTVDPSFPLPDVTIFFKPSANQQASLQQLLAAQQNPASPDFHKWLTPEQYAARFGVNQDDVNRIGAWLQSQGLEVRSVARSRTWIHFRGSAQQVQNALHTEIHQYLENGRSHYANATDPSIPAALSDLVLGFQGLNDFRLKPRIKARGLIPENNTGRDHQIVPDDFATIYDVAPLYTAGLDGTGQKLAIMGQTDIDVSDIQMFRSKYNLPAINLQQILVPHQSDPGTSQDDLPEADLDLEWGGAVARNATIIYVYSGDVFTSLQYAIDQALAPVISLSYGGCEGSGVVFLTMDRTMAQQANAEGITWVNAAGDSGAADCEDPDATIAQDGLAVDAPGSVPEVTAMGGTEFNEGGGDYWSSTNTLNGASALSYIPERVWNDTSLGGGLAAGGGGTSIYFPKPVWQAGVGVPSDTYRNVPDVSLAASADHDGYYVYTSGQFQIYGGTSVATPTMAGIITLLNQYLISSGGQSQAGLGNVNPTLYRIAQNTSGVFHDVTVGDNSVPCVIGSPDCTTGSFGYSATPGYDRSSGLGSLDAYNLIHQWTSQAPTASAVVPSIDNNPVFETPANGSGDRWSYTITLTEEAGVGTTLTGFTINGQPQDITAVFGTITIPPDGSLTSKGLGFSTLAVPTNVVFGFTGVDASGTQWSEQLTIPFDGPQTPLVIGGASNAASGQQSYAPGMLLSVYGTAFGNFAQSAGTIPLPQYLAGFEASVNGVTTPLYYVSPNQVNLQIPYETPLGNATLVVGNPYVNSNNYTIKIVPAAPGIFMTNGFTAAPFSSAMPGETTTLFITGEGQVSPSLADGASPSSGTSPSLLPKPKLPVTVTVANQSAIIAFIGIPSGLVGVTQINYVVPENTPIGVQQVVVTVGGVATQAANLTVTQ
ncbi:MAG: S8 family serine peptidase [Bryobacterales bacterium]|nr:S8 family serine peptidase [Bryobacterales bacterium]